MEHWTSQPEAPAQPARSVWTAMLRGARCRCPNCGEGRLFGRFLKAQPACEVCGEELHHQRADDFPPYITMFIVGHIVVWLILVAELRWNWPVWAHAATWPLLTVGLSLGLLQPVKGAVIGLQWALRMHGFGEEAGDPEETLRPVTLREPGTS